jgi:hypothetical protein
MTKKIYLIAFVFISIETYSPQLKERDTFLVSVKPLKFIYCIKNIGFEYRSSSAISTQSRIEYDFTNYIIKKENFPDFVIGLELRYPTLKNKDDGDSNDLYLGAFTQYFWPQNVEHMKFFYRGAELGYKYLFGAPFNIHSKMFITSPISKPGLLPDSAC